MRGRKVSDEPHYLFILFLGSLKNNQGKTAGDLAKERNKIDVSQRILKQTQPRYWNTERSFSRSSQCFVYYFILILYSQSGASLSEEAKDPSRRRDSSEAGVDWRQEEIISILECPVCLETMRRRIFQCRNGHNVCENCSANPALTTCPQCREPYRYLCGYLLVETIFRLDLHLLDI